jgi:hypothetical protein
MMRETQNIIDHRTIALRAMASVEEWRTIQKPPSLKTKAPKEHWLLLEEGWVKINKVGAFH